MRKIKKYKLNWTTQAIAGLLFVACLMMGPLSGKALASHYTFPIIGPASYSNDYHGSRPSGPHHAIDIFARKHQKVVSVVNGTITFVGYPQPSWGYSVFIRGDDGYTYYYIHLNNDTPGTDDGRGGGMDAYAPDMEPGNRVVRGQHIGYVGDSGNAETTPPHLHFEVTYPNGSPHNPYGSLNSAIRISQPVKYPGLSHETLPFGNSFKGGVQVAMGNFDLDPAFEMVAGAGEGGGPHVKVYDSNHKTQLYNFFGFGSAFRGGVDVAAGDVDSDGIDEVIVTAGPGKEGSTVAIYKLGVGGAVTQLSHFTAYPGFKGGVNVAAGDVDSDGADEIITGTGPGGGPHVKVFEANGQTRRSFFAYEASFRGGVDVAAGNTHLAAIGDEIVTMPETVGSARIQVFSLDLTRHANFYAFGASYRGGGRVSVGNVTGNAATASEIVAVPRNTVPVAWIMNGQGNKLSQTYFLEEWWKGSYDIGAGAGDAVSGTGVNRRATVRNVL